MTAASCATGLVLTLLLLLTLMVLVGHVAGRAIDKSEERARNDY